MAGTKRYYAHGNPPESMPVYSHKANAESHDALSLTLNHAVNSGFTVLIFYIANEAGRPGCRCNRMTLLAMKEC